LHPSVRSALALLAGGNGKDSIVPGDLDYYLIYLPLGAIGLARWLIWLVRRVPAVLYRPVTGECRLPLTVVVPVYQEDPEVFTRALRSWLANEVDEIILVVDATDAACRRIAADYSAADFRVTVLVTDVPGKRDALRRGWEHAGTPLVALVDSDTVWAADVATEVRKPFADPAVGGVATRQNVDNPRGFLQRITDLFLDCRYFDECAAQTVMGRALSCLSGRTAVYRRDLLVELTGEFMTETFLGVPCMSGDDKRLTTLLLERGHATVLQRSARVWSSFPSTWRPFCRQRLRWARNTWRSDLRALSRRWVWRRPFLAFTMVDKAVSGFTLLVSPTLMTLGLTRHHWFFCGCLACWWWLSRAAKALPHLRRRPSSFFLIPGWILLSFALSGIKLCALVTVRRQHWLTRQVAVENGVVVRTAEPAVEAVP
jgi:hyaluronan synthase